MKHVPTTTLVKIVSDGWAAYNKLTEMGYQHCTVIHDVVNAGGEHNNSVESLWSQVKMWFASMHGVHEAHFDHY